jgi:hypothetical protein
MMGLVSKWLDRLALWQFVLFYGGCLLLGILVGGAGINWLIGHHINLASLIGFAAVFTAATTIGTTWARQKRLRRNPSA